MPTAPTIAPTNGAKAARRLKYAIKFLCWFTLIEACGYLALLITMHPEAYTTAEGHAAMALWSAVCGAIMTVLSIDE
jgi:hypothetical protein